MPATGYVPVQCDICARHQLQLVVPGVVPSCDKCGRSASVLPGAAYGAGDVELFDRIDGAVYRELGSPVAGRRLNALLSRAAPAFARSSSVLLSVVDELPALRFLMPALSVKPTPREEQSTIARALGMLHIIVTARIRQLERAASAARISS